MDLNAQIEKAFDYRGDVTLHLKDGRQVVGFLFNRETQGAARCAEPFVEMMLQGTTEKLLIKSADIKCIEFTGEDTAAGKSWEEWIAKEEARKKAEAVQK